MLNVSWIDQRDQNIHVQQKARHDKSSSSCRTISEVTRGAPGVYNVAEDDGAVTVAKAHSELGFDPVFRLSA